MADNIVPIGSAEGSYLCSILLYRRPNGSIGAVLDDMPVHVIESEPTITARLFKVAQWCFDGMLDLMRQGVRFDDETRLSINDEEAGHGE